MMRTGIFAFLIFFSGAVMSEELMAIKHPVPSVYSLSRQDVTWMFTMKSRFWPDGTRVRVFYLDPSSVEHERFCWDVLGISPGRFDQLANTYLDTGNISYFRQVKNKSEMYYKVGLYPGSIGYLDKSTIVVNGKWYVHELRIE